MIQKKDKSQECHRFSVIVWILGVINIISMFMPDSHVDQRGANDEVVVGVAPASTLYHLIVAAMELLDHFELIEKL